MEDEVRETTLPTKRIMGWVGTVSALLGLGASIFGGVTWYQSRREHKAVLASQMAVAREQSREGEYRAAVRSYDAILKDNPLDPEALRQQLATTMLWVENFQVKPNPEPSDTAALGQDLDEIFSILQAGMTRAKGSEAADVQAHLGWAHWTNQKVADREPGQAAEQNLRAALKLDPANPYANAMLGDWIIQNGGDGAEALRHFETAVAAGRARPVVRMYQIGGLSHDDGPLLPQMFKVASEMRHGGESLDEISLRRVQYYSFNPPRTQQADVVACLSILPEGDAWDTYQWLGTNASMKIPEETRDFIHATLLEIHGKRAEALAIYTSMQKQMGDSYSLKRRVDEAVARLSTK